MDDVEAASLARLLANPLRVGFLRALSERRVLSPIEYAREGGLDLREVARHVRALSGAEVIDVVEVVARRGAFEHRYAPNGERGRSALLVVGLLSVL
jgi:DNA-binding transcriptional ArsR family regulator